MLSIDHKRLISLSACTTLFAPALYAKVDGDTLKRGKESYAMYCAACHGENGKGAGEGNFPPLAGSNWLKGKPDRAIQVVLHGLDGEVTVNRKRYNLAMPPQGQTLNDQQIADVLSFVRSSWGNKEAAVTREQVEIARKSTESRKTPWKQAEIEKRYGLPINKSKVVKDNLIMHTYEGKWNKLPDFTKLEVAATEEEHSGYISLQNIYEEKNFGVVWEGEILIRSDHTYKFALECTDGARFVLDGHEVIKLDGLSAKARQKQGGVTLKKGWHKFRLEFFNASGDPQIRLSMGIGGLSLISDPLERVAPQKIILSAQEQKARLYRHFVAGGTPYTLSIAYPGKINLAYDTQSCSPVIMWKGDFIDASRHWNGRGKGWQNVASSSSTRLEAKNLFGQSAQFKSYKLDENRFPTFVYTLGEEITVSDQFTPSSKGFERSLTIKNTGALRTLPIHLQSMKGAGMGVHFNEDTQTPDEIRVEPGVTSLKVNYIWK
ncbi:hypothetical protein Rhal01_00143 [Rubritalea halochordaticola]|uniref:C-type cytochrome n=1 Tax=Rubritalea halochordaticola TaxID=714537 RepID=A0ABP9UWD1_9BACT